MKLRVCQYKKRNRRDIKMWNWNIKVLCLISYEPSTKKVVGIFYHKSSNKNFYSLVRFTVCRDGNGAGRGRVSLSHTHPRIKNSSPSPYPNPTGIKLFFHPHPHRVTDIISYPYSYPCSNYFNINFYKRKKITVKKT